MKRNCKNCQHYNKYLAVRKAFVRTYGYYKVKACTFNNKCPGWKFSLVTVIKVWWKKVEKRFINCY